MILRSLLLLLYAYPFWTNAQVERGDPITERARSFYAALARVDAMSDDDMADHGGELNASLGNHLIQLLESPGLTDRQIDSLVHPSDLYRTRSADGRLSIFSWDERTGGSFQAQASVVLYIMANGERRGIYSTVDDGATWNKGGTYASIHAIRSDSTSTLYACVGTVIGCNTCCGNMLTVFELTSEGINFDYPAFANVAADNQTSGTFSPTYLLTTRCGDGLEFDYDPNTSVLTYVYVADDLTPIIGDGLGPRQKINGSLHFNGERFEAE